MMTANPTPTAKVALFFMCAYVQYFESSHSDCPPSTIIAPNVPKMRALQLACTLVFIILGLTNVAKSATLEMPPKRNECADPIPNTCTFYSACLEAHYNCGVCGYPLAYGQFYCEKFLASKSEFSSEGQAWVSNTTMCLQRALIVESAGSSTLVVGCDALLVKAFSSHARCYVENGLCTLPPTDWLLIVRIVGLKSLFSNAAAISQSVLASTLCLEYFGGKLLKFIISMR
jgi:Stanniocalcin family